MSFYGSIIKSISCWLLSKSFYGKSRKLLRFEYKFPMLWILGFYAWSNIYVNHPKKPRSFQMKFSKHLFSPTLFLWAKSKFLHQSISLCGLFKFHFNLSHKNWIGKINAINQFQHYFQPKLFKHEEKKKNKNKDRK